MKPKPRQINTVDKQVNQYFYDENEDFVRRSERIRQGPTVRWYVNADGVEMGELRNKKTLCKSSTLATRSSKFENSPSASRRSKLKSSLDEEEHATSINKQRFKRSFTVVSLNKDRTCWNQSSWGEKRKRKFLKGVSAVSQHAQFYRLTTRMHLNQNTDCKPKGWNRMAKLLIHRNDNYNSNKSFEREGEECSAGGGAAALKKQKRKCSTRERAASTRESCVKEAATVRASYNYKPTLLVVHPYKKRIERRATQILKQGKSALNERHPQKKIKRKKLRPKVQKDIHSLLRKHRINRNGSGNAKPADGCKVAGRGLFEAWRKERGLPARARKRSKGRFTKMPRAKLSRQFKVSQNIWRISTVIEPPKLCLTDKAHIFPCSTEINGGNIISMFSTAEKTTNFYARCSNHKIVAEKYTVQADYQFFSPQERFNDEWLLEASSDEHGQRGQQDDFSSFKNHSSNLLQLQPAFRGLSTQYGASSLCSATDSRLLTAQGIEPLINKHLRLVPYNSDREIVLSTHSKRSSKKHQAKVQLDEETIRVWLLLENGGTLPEEEDEEKARIWDGERAVMEGRVDYFIKLMRDVQGDRRFSRWKGSVLDSVVGALLTQNTSDHLSSSAFMSLASRYAPNWPQTLDLQEADTFLELSVNDDQSEVLDRLEIRPDVHNLDNFRNYHAYDAIHSTENVRNYFCGGSPLDINFEESDGLEEREQNFFCENALSKIYEQTKQNQNYCDRTETDSSLCLIKQPDIGVEEFFLSKQQSIQDSGLEEREQTCSCENELSKIYEQTKQNQNYCDRIETDSSFCLKKQPDIGVEECSLSKQQSIQEIQTGQKPVSSVLVSGNTKRRVSLVNTISGIKRAKLEASQSGRKKTERDWESLRRNVLDIPSVAVKKLSTVSDRRSNEQDAVNWEAVRLAEVGEVADAIKERGMHNTLAGRIQAFLNTLHEEQGNLDLEWIRKLSTEDASEYLRDVRGLGIKSVECIRLLTLHHAAFPVDTNVARVCVRLGWVPIEPLPEQFQMHLLELYPFQQSIQKYLWPRLCKLDRLTLYELHYQMITFGKVFCTKRRPNCNSCPLRMECKHFASAYSSSKLLLTFSSDDTVMANSVDLPSLSAAESDIIRIDNLPSDVQLMTTVFYQQKETCEPIIEEPATPDGIFDMEDIIDHENPESEDAYYIDEVTLNGLYQDVSFNRLDDHSTHLIKMSDIMSEGIWRTSQHSSPFYTSGSQLESTTSGFMSERHSLIGIKDLNLGSMPLDTQIISPFARNDSVVPLPIGSSFIPMPKIKNIGRLQTIHHVYVIPDGHELLKEMDVRVEGDPCHYLLAVWSPAKAPRSRKINHCCKEDACVPTHRTTNRHDQNVKGTLLIPCRTAMRGAFPLNGTYFQVNEVFADHDSSLKPLNIPRSWIWNWRRSFVYFGTSTQHIFRGLSIEEIKTCFFLGHVCVRGFDRKTRAPKPLVTRLHFPISQQSKTQKRKEQNLDL